MGWRATVGRDSLGCMDDRFKDVAIRLMKSLGQEVDVEYFSEDDVWAFVGDLFLYAEQEKPLSAATQQILLDLGIALGLKPGAPERDFLPALQAQVGPSPHGEEVIIAVVRYVRAQANGQFETTRPADQSSKLTGGDHVGPHHVHKNYDFGSD